MGDSIIDEDALSARLQACTSKKLRMFDELRTGSTLCPFWDIIVLTATDEDQAHAYSAQLETKRLRKEIPGQCKYLVFPDPRGPKIGNGGATLHALEQLEEAHGSELDNLKILLIHAGGYSKRLPNVSVVGKIFTALPFGNPVYTMLEMKLASYIEFPQKMSPGVFVTCADDIELLDCDGDLSFTGSGFTALGHPSTLDIGTTHGVFVLDKASAAAASNAKPFKEPPCVRAVCARFTHKPPVQRMHDLGAPIPATGQVYTDSAYYFDRPTAKLLLEFYSANKPLSVEVDAYGDFLQALGPESTDEYTRDASNVITDDDDLASTRLKLYNHLRKTPLNVILCNLSKFYHIGTIPEYLFHYTTDSRFRTETGCVREAFALRSNVDEESKASGALGDVAIIHSVVPADVVMGSKTIIEYSTLAPGSSIGDDCVISCLSVASPVHVPSGVFLHTTKTAKGYVTIVYGTSEDLKSGAKYTEAKHKLTLCNTTLGPALARLQCPQSSLWAPSTGKCTLWNATLFPCLPTEHESATYAIHMAALALGLPDTTTLDPPLASLELLDMQGILQTKDLQGILDSRSHLRDTIAAGLQ
eukprot:m.617572 g.617572  ORF g.617572 m.617572 type:complete len:587 (-) comp22519_c0_seq4:163-1923(-)